MNIRKIDGRIPDQQKVPFEQIPVGSTWAHGSFGTIWLKIPERAYANSVRLDDGSYGWVNDSALVVPVHGHFRVKE